MNTVKKTLMAGAFTCLIGSALLPMDASAQSGSRLCGAAINVPTGTMGMMVEIKQPGGKKTRRRANNFCNSLAQGILDGFAKQGLDISDNNRGWFKRSECEGVASWMSGGTSRADICEQMERTSIGNGANPYLVMYNKATKKFTVTKPQ